MSKSRAIIKREKKTTIIYCKENSINDIVFVLRNFNKSKLWDKSKYDWTMDDWSLFLTLKLTLNPKQNNEL